MAHVVAVMEWNITPTELAMPAASYGLTSHPITYPAGGGPLGVPPLFGRRS